MSAASLEAVRDGRVAARRVLSEGQPLVIGRGEQADWRPEGEPYLSRRHVSVSWSGKVLRVAKAPEASNPVLHEGESSDGFVLEDGGCFVIGRTQFRFVLARAAAGPEPSLSYTLDPADLYAAGDSADRLRLHDLLALPDILRHRDRGGFHAHIAGLLRLATGAAWSCVLAEDGRVLGEDGADDLARFSASRALLAKAVADAPQPSLYSWKGRAGAVTATPSEGIDWAICAAARLPDGSALAFYAAGGGNGQGPLKESARFVGLVADIVGRTLAGDQHLAQEKRLERYFSGPVVKKILKSANPADLEPRLAHGTVMFFDIRGFARASEERMADTVEHLRALKRVMTAMTDVILEENGVILQYVGDAIYACWNLPFEDPEHVDRACRAALSLGRELPRVEAGWSCGIGLHCGPVVAGAMGSEQIFSYGVMGPVVNLASRIEGITKRVGVPILASADVAARASPGVAAPARVGRFLPAGLKAPIDLFELGAPPWAAGRAEGLAAFEGGDWARARAALAPLAARDPAARFLLSLAQSEAPAGWAGIIALAEK